MNYLRILFRIAIYNIFTLFNSIYKCVLIIILFTLFNLHYLLRYITAFTPLII